MVSPSFSPISATLGVCCDLRGGIVSLATVSCHHDPRYFLPSIWNHQTLELPQTLIDAIRGRGLDPTTMEERHWMAARLTEFLNQGVQSQLNLARNSPLDILLAVIEGGEVWQVDPLHRSTESLVLSAMIAEGTGISVLDDLSAKDLVQGGLGGPIDGPGFWLLLGDRSIAPGVRWRGLVDLGETFRLTIVPPIDSLSRRPPFLSFDVGPGIALLRELGTPFEGESQSNNFRSQGGSFPLAVEGKTIPELLTVWQAMLGPAFSPWLPQGVNPLPWVYAAQNLGRDRGHHFAFPDLLATGVRLISERLVSSVLDLSRQGHPLGELILTGPGSRDGLLLRTLQQGLTGIKVATWSEAEVPEFSGFPGGRELSAAAVACVGLLHLWQVPISFHESTVPRIPGRLTPGKPANWMAVLQQLNANLPWMLPLREAV